MSRIHRSPYAGSWYPEDTVELRRLVEDALSRSQSRTGPELFPNPIAFVVPHAGLMYSGTVACAAYRYLEARRPRRIVLLGFSHHGGPGGISIPDVNGFETPLGVTEVDTEAVALLSGARVVDEDDVCDHSVEIQLPLLQFVAPDARIVPVYIGRVTSADQHAAACALALLADGETVFLASSDLTHYGQQFGYQPFPVNADTADNLADLDDRAIEDAGSLDADLFLEGLRETGATVCGRAPIALLLRTLSLLSGEEIFQQRLDYQTSGDVTGDFHHSVSYGALGYFPATSFQLNRREGEELLAATRRSLDRFLRGGAETEWPEPAPALLRRQALFVTLRTHGRLRGCLGCTDNATSIVRSACRLAISAATEDQRFVMIRPEESRDIEVEISLLTPMKRICSRDSHRLHEHGALLQCGSRRSLLLPQVSRERSWTGEQFWNALARKGGFSTSAYNDPDTRLSVFRAQVI